MYHQGNDKTPISFVISKHIINSYSNWTIKIRYILVYTTVVLILYALPVCKTRRRVKSTDNANHYPYKWCASVSVCLLMKNQKVDILWTCKITNYLSHKTLLNLAYVVTSRIFESYVVLTYYRHQCMNRKLSNYYHVFWNGIIWLVVLFISRTLK